MTDISEDERDIELESVSAIYPELEKVQSHIATLDIEVIPATPLQITFEPGALPIPPPAADLRQPGSTERVDPIQYAVIAAAAIAPADVHTIAYLPTLHLHITLPQGYPEEKPPEFKITSSPSWLSSEKIQELEDEGEKLWEEYGQSQVVFAYIDFLQQEAERAFGLTDVTLPNHLKEPILSHDKAVKKQKFDNGTFSCGVCLEPKKGSACHQLRRCGHVFCVACLQDTYNYSITEGDVGAIKCLDPDCGKQNMTAAQRRLKKQKTLHPKELLDIPIERTKVQRYADLKTKKRLESDKGTIYCPRKWCQGPAKSLKYARYDKVNLEDYPESSDEEEPSEPGGAAAAEEAAPQAASGRYAYTKPPPDRLVSRYNRCPNSTYSMANLSFPEYMFQMPIRLLSHLPTLLARRTHQLPAQHHNRAHRRRTSILRLHPATHLSMSKLLCSVPENSWLQPHDMFPVLDALLLSMLCRSPIPSLSLYSRCC